MTLSDVSNCGICDCDIFIIQATGLQGLPVTNTLAFLTGLGANELKNGPNLLNFVHFIDE